MSVETKMHLNPEFNVKDIATYLSTKDNVTDVKFKMPLDDEPVYFTIAMIYNDNNYIIHFHHNRGLFKSHLLTTFTLLDESECLLKDIAETFGGVYNTRDTNDNAVIYQDTKYNTNNAIFIHKWAMVRGIVKDSTLHDFCVADDVFNRTIDKYRK